MPLPPLDVIGIGNAIVDVIARAEDSFVLAEGLAKGTMTLIDQSQGEALYQRMGSGVEVSGGSAANTMAGFASFGGQGGYIGKVRDDQLGEVFRHDIRAIGVHYDTTPAVEGPSTARCLILVTPDAQRTMATFLGVSVELGPQDLDAAAIGSAQITYLEGYLFDKPRAKEAFVEAARVAHGKGRKVALTLSDPFCVNRHKAEFKALVADHVDILFANEAELLALTDAGDFDEAVATVRTHCEVAAVTRGAKGSAVIADGKVLAVPAEPIDTLVDTTGAGDLYAAGFLFGYTHGQDLHGCGALGSLAAAEIISHIGARPEKSLKELARARFPALATL
jgi:sugar/nucleoside kinase (ribokinase family)